jgi:signal transduction histidine kinase
MSTDPRMDDLHAELRLISHDLNNLIGIIVNYAAFVAEELEPGSPAARDLDEIKRAAEQATALSRRLRAVCD